jgi:hypothetical protein
MMSEKSTPPVISQKKKKEFELHVISVKIFWLLLKTFSEARFRNTQN